MTTSAYASISPSNNKRYALDSEQWLKLWIFKCLDAQSLIYFIIAVNESDAMEFLVEGLDNPDHVNVPMSYTLDQNNFDIKHPELGWLHFEYEYREMGKVIIGPTTQYGLLYVLE